MEMACSSCESAFQSNQSVVVSVIKSGTTAFIFVQNQGRNIAHLRRILVCSSFPGGGSSTTFLRPPPSPVSWSGPEYLEPGTGVTYFSFTPNAGSTVQAQAEYIEIEARSRSCPEQF
jgi:hypothetical protein